MRDLRPQVVLAFRTQHGVLGGFGPSPERLRQQFEGVIWRFRTGGQWREVPREFGAWPTVQALFSYSYRQVACSAE